VGDRPFFDKKTEYQGRFMIAGCNPFAITLDPGGSLQYNTGSWRTQRSPRMNRPLFFSLGNVDFLEAG
jgi:hypothetical protein